MKGKRQVVATRESKRGLTNNVVQVGEIGYVLGTREDDHWLIIWPDINPAYAGDWKVSSHDCADFRMTGKFHG